jgi:hypothetical protein
MVVWYLAGLKKSCEVSLSMTPLRRMNVDRYATYRAVAALEAAGLLSVQRQKGRKSLVTLLQLPNKLNGGAV